MPHRRSKYRIPASSCCAVVSVWVATKGQVLMNAALSWVPGIERPEIGISSGRKHIQSARCGRAPSFRVEADISDI
ncbi:hypothetical protein KCU99_g252, partial [Aureobasidium melanogenum]